MKPDARVPILDMRMFDQRGAPERRAFVDALGAAYRDCGFVGLRRHGVDADVIAQAYAAIEAFFKLPLETRRSHAASRDLGGGRGYTEFGIEHARDQPAPDLKEFFQIGRELPAGASWAGGLSPNRWPREVEGFIERVYPLFRALEFLSRRVLSAVALHLGLAADYFADKVDHGDDVLRAIHYPPLPESIADPRVAGNERVSVRSAAHEDINLITLLVGSGEPGLEIRSRQGAWIPVDTIPGVIVCNVGDMLQRLTNRVLRSTTHRVVNPPPPHSQRSRYSIPYFVHPNPEFVIETLPGCVDETNHYPSPVTASAFLRERLVEIGLLRAEAREDAARARSGQHGFTDVAEPASAGREPRDPELRP